MALLSAPTNFLVQTGNGQIYLSWQPSVGAQAYNVLRSTDGLNFYNYASTTSIFFYDVAPTTGAVNYYQVAPTSASTTGIATAIQGLTPLGYGQQCLSSIRLAAQQRADQVNSNYVSTTEWNSYINHSYTELVDLLVAAYGSNYSVKTPYIFTSDGRDPALYPLPTDFYKLLGVDLGLGANSTGWLTLRRFDFLSRNNYVFGNTPVTFLGVLGLRYDLVDSNLMFIPSPAANQNIRMWYVPRPKVLLSDSDILDGIAGWDEYVIVDAAIKAMQKGEDDVTVLLAQKQALKDRIQSMARARDIGEPEGVSDTRRLDGAYGMDPFSGGPFGSY